MRKRPVARATALNQEAAGCPAASIRSSEGSVGAGAGRARVGNTDRVGRSGPPCLPGIARVPATPACSTSSREARSPPSSAAMRRARSKNPPEKNELIKNSHWLGAPLGVPCGRAPVKDVAHRPNAATSAEPRSRPRGHAFRGGRISRLCRT